MTAVRIERSRNAHHSSHSPQGFALEADRVRLTPAALEAIVNIAEAWKLPGDDAAALLGVSSSTWDRFRRRQMKSDAEPGSDDQGIGADRYLQGPEPAVRSGDGGSLAQASKQGAAVSQSFSGRSDDRRRNPIHVGSSPVCGRVEGWFVTLGYDYPVARLPNPARSGWFPPSAWKTRSLNASSRPNNACGTLKKSTGLQVDALRRNARGVTISHPKSSSSGFRMLFSSMPPSRISGHGR